MLEQAKAKLGFIPNTYMLLAERPAGWGITRFERNFYIQRKHLPLVTEIGDV